MKVPEEIRNVKRPKNTIVFVYGKNQNLYGVKERRFVEVNGRVVQRDGKMIGRIIDGQYVQNDERPTISYSESDFLYWADYQLVVNLTKDIFEDLCSIYNRADAEKCYVMAVLRAIEGGIKDDELKDAYENSYLRILYPGVPLGRNTVCDFLYNLGRTCSRITEFGRMRASRIPENHYLAVDGMLKSDESEVNSFSDYSRKALKKGTRDVSVLYAFDTEEMEPVCNAIYPGNVLDVSAFRDFMTSNSITRGVIIADKGFTYKSAKDVFLDNPGLHFIIPLRRNQKIVDEYKALMFDSALSNRCGIECRKIRMHDGRFLYSYRDIATAKVEEEGWISKHSEYDPAELAQLRLSFGTIVFISDLDTQPEFVYAAYEERWEIEVLFRFYKDIMELDETRVVNETSVLGTEFINLLSVIMVCRLRKTFVNNRTLCKKSFRKNMRLLRKGVMVRSDAKSDWEIRRITGSEEKLFIEMGIIKTDQPAPRKRGRPPKQSPQ